MRKKSMKPNSAPAPQESKYAAYRKQEDTSQKPQNFKGTLRRLIEMLKPYKIPVITVFVVASTATILNVFTPDIMGDIIDAFTTQLNNRLDGLEMDFTETIRLTLKIVYFYFGFTICEFIQTYLMAGVSQRLVCDIREKVNIKLSHIPLRYFDKSTKGEIISKIVNDCDNLSSTLQSNITTVVTSALQVIGVAIMMFISSWQLALISMILVPVSAFFARVISKRSKILFRKFWDKTGDLNGHIEEMYTGHNIVRIFNHQKKATAEFDEITDELMDVSVKANFVSGLLKPILSIFWNLTYVLVCFTGAMLVLNMPGGRTGGTLAGNIGFVVAFIQYAGMFSSPINNIAGIVNTIQSCLASAERVFTLVDEEDETEIEDGKTLDDPQGVVEFKDVCFRYLPDKPLIENL
ncbi:MAG: ABC transporter ATP-binding protein, partial [Clostridia bacterium]|nr:ABC transporter ATP-binding protein [Clostridia bacterium]